jgi:hypothetical protein
VVSSRWLQYGVAFSTHVRDLRGGVIIREPAQIFFALARACPSLLNLKQAEKHQKFQKLKSNLELPQKFLSAIFLKSKKGAK